MIFFSPRVLGGENPAAGGKYTVRVVGGGGGVAGRGRRGGAELEALQEGLVTVTVLPGWEFWESWALEGPLFWWPPHRAHSSPFSQHCLTLLRETWELQGPSPEAC